MRCAIEQKFALSAVEVLRLGDAGRPIADQIARFGKLAGRDLSARAFAALRARRTYDPQRHGDAEDYEPLSAGEQLELSILRTAITRDSRTPAAASDDNGKPARTY